VDTDRETYPNCWPTGSATRTGVPFSSRNAASNGCAMTPPSRQKNSCPAAYIVSESPARIVFVSVASSEETPTSEGWPAPTATYRKWRPSGRNCGHRCVVSPRAASSVDAGVAVPPDAFTRASGPVVDGAKRIVLSALQVPPRPLGALHTVIGVP